jgi:AbrB family looped-hinge helix DNA binding protein
MKIVAISDKGQVTLPVEVRRRLDLQPGSRMEVEIKGDSLLLRPMKSLRSLKGFFAAATPAAREDSWDKVRRETERRVAREVAGEDRR